MLNIQLHMNDLNITDHELDLINSYIDDIQEAHETMGFARNDKLKVQYELSRILDELNKNGDISDEVVQNLTYTIEITPEEPFTEDEKAILYEIRDKFEELDELFIGLSDQAQVKTLDFHNEGSSLNHRIRWGYQAADDLITMLIENR